ncbi:alpha/beta hydrolase-fold protein [Lysobacter humi (ex Lee et al. 2017)]
MSAFAYSSIAGASRLGAVLLAATLMVGGGAAAGAREIAPSAVGVSAVSSEAPTATDPRTVIDVLHIDAPGVADTPLRVRVLRPPGYSADAAPGYAVLYVNDGQDAEAVNLADTLEGLAATRTIRAPLVVAIDMPPDRLGAYGYSDRAAGRSIVAPTRHGDVGTRAHAYSEWLAKTLVPLIDARYRTRTTPDARAILGWSLGAAHAFNMGWQYPEVFGRVGAFSPSFWLSTDGTDAPATQRTRIAQSLVHGMPPRNGARFFLAVGTAEETDDRDVDGINDALDDTRDLALGWNADAGGLKGLRQAGYRVDADWTTRPGRGDVALHVLEGGTHRQDSWARMLPDFLRWAYAVRAPRIEATGTVEGWQDLPSKHVAARTVDVWLPPSYGSDPSRRYPVLYMHDGQNLFDPALAYTGVDWDVDGAMTRLVAEGAVREAIVVGIWNTPLRFSEYMPRRPIEAAPPHRRAFMGEARIEGVRSDAYLRFVVEELKPFIDSTYRTRPGRGDTYVMGSSMGGLISLYALAEYPRVFGGAAAVSTHWPAGEGIVIDWLATQLPRAGVHRLYFDFGTATLDAQYAPYQARMDARLPGLGYRAGHDWLTRRFEGAAHNEAAWKARLDVPLRFLLGMPQAGAAP